MGTSQTGTQFEFYSSSHEVSMYIHVINCNNYMIVDLVKSCENHPTVICKVKTAVQITHLLKVSFAKIIS